MHLHRLNTISYHVWTGYTTVHFALEIPTGGAIIAFYMQQ